MEKKDIILIREKLINQIKQHMVAHEITQEEVADKTGFTQSNVSRMLASKYSPSLDNLILVCRAVGMKIELKSAMYKKGSSSADVID